MVKTFRRVVTGHDDRGRAVIVSDAPPPRVYDQLGQAGLVFHEVWNTRESPARIDRDGGEPPEAGLNLAPPARGTRIRVLEIPVGEPTADEMQKVFANSAASHARVGAQAAKHVNFHRTETIDYGIVLEGELTLILDEGETTLQAGDICVQRGTNHAWSNRGKTPCRIAFILVDGRWDDEIAGTPVE